MAAQRQTPKVQLLLTREASMAAMSLGVGLTHLGSYNYAETGYFYSGMYSYCMGLERVLKIVAIYDYRIRNDDRFPTNRVLKDFSHGLSDLLVHAQSIVTSHSLAVDSSHTQDTLHRPIVSWLNDFAYTTRYYNLDTLTGRNHSSDEPLIRWEKEVCREIVVRHYRPTTVRRQEIEMVKAMLEPYAHVRHTSGAGMQLHDVSSTVEESAMADVKQRYSKFYLYRLSRFACNVLCELEYAGNFFPNLREFFPLFTSDDRSWILRRKSWNPYKP